MGQTSWSRLLTESRGSPARRFTGTTMRAGERGRCLDRWRDARACRQRRADGALAAYATIRLMPGSRRQASKRRGGFCFWQPTRFDVVESAT